MLVSQRRNNPSYPAKTKQGRSLTTETTKQCWREQRNSSFIFLTVPSEQMARDPSLKVTGLDSTQIQSLNYLDFPPA